MGPVFVVITPLLIIVFAFVMSQIEKYFVLWGTNVVPQGEKMHAEVDTLELSAVEIDDTVTNGLRQTDYQNIRNTDG